MMKKSTEQRMASLYKNAQATQIRLENLKAKVQTERNSQKREQFQLEALIQQHQLAVYVGKLQLLQQFGK